MRLPPDMTPEMAFQSIGFTLAARTALRTCPGLACGSGASAHSRTSGPPYALNCNARIHHSSRRGGSAAASRGQPPSQPSQVSLDQPRAVRCFRMMPRSWKTESRRPGGAVFVQPWVVEPEPDPQTGTTALLRLVDPRHAETTTSARDQMATASSLNATR